MALVLGFAVHVLLPQVDGLTQGLQNLLSGRWPFLLLAIVGSSLSFVAAAWMVRASVDDPPPWGPTVVVQLAAVVASVITPMGLGWVVTNESFLRNAGIDEPTARAATGLNMVLTFVSHVALLLLALPFLPTLSLPAISPPQRRVFVDVAAVIAMVAGVVLWIPKSRRRVLALIRPTLAAVPGVIRNPRRSTAMVAGAALVNLAYGLALYASVAAFGPAAPPLGVLVVYLLAATVAVIAPTPGGLGAMEAALVAALTRIAVPGSQAVAATLAFRLVTFWLPLLVGAVAMRSSRKRGWV